tara:strand:- start:135 stop:479 length:345 start_codon:yes stop_codon:yes gene_type:complete
VNNMSLEEEKEEFDPVEYLKSLDLEHFINCKNTNDILIENHQVEYESFIKTKIEELYKKYNTAFRDIKLFGKDWDNEQAESFSHLVYNFISVKYDLNIFYENPYLAIDLIKFKE